MSYIGKEDRTLYYLKIKTRQPVLEFFFFEDVHLLNNGFTTILFQLFLSINKSETRGELENDIKEIIRQKCLFNEGKIIPMSKKCWNGFVQDIKRNITEIVSHEFFYKDARYDFISNQSDFHLKKAIYYRQIYPVIFSVSNQKIDSNIKEKIKNKNSRSLPDTPPTDYFIRSIFKIAMRIYNIHSFVLSKKSGIDFKSFTNGFVYERAWGDKILKGTMEDFENFKQKNLDAINELKQNNETKKSHAATSLNH